MDLYYFRHFNELSEAAKTKRPKEMSVPVKALLMVSCVLAAPFALVAGLICLTGIMVGGVIHSATHPDESKADKISDDEFEATVSEIEEVQQKLVQLQKRSKYYNLVYRYHKIDGFVNTAATKHTNINVRDQFEKGKVVTPILNVIYFCTDGIAEYKNLLKTFPNQDIPYYEGENEDYEQDIMQHIGNELDKHLYSLGFNNSSGSVHSDKYPHCQISVKSSGDGMWVYIMRKGKNFVIRNTDNN